MERRSVRLSDVAAVAGVSPSTASKVLNGRGRVAPETRERVHEAAKRLDFQPDALAQFFATGKSRTIGILTRNAPSTFAMPVLVGAMTALGLAEMAGLMIDGVLRDNARKLHARRIDGLLVIGEDFGAPIHSISDGFSVPVAYAFGVSDNPADVSFVPDNVMAGRIAVEHLIDIGRSRIAHITGENDLAADDRIRGLNEVLGERNLDLASGSPLRGPWTRQWGVEATHRLLDSGTSFDAIFCGNDAIALGAYTVLRDAGLQVPRDVAIIGFDNWPGVNELGDHLLTTIDPNLLELGKVAVRHLLEHPDSPYGPGINTQECTLFVGESTAPPTTLGADELPSAS